MQIVMNCMPNLYRVILLVGVILSKSCYASDEKLDVELSIEIYKHSEYLIKVVYQNNSLFPVNIARWDLAEGGLLTKKLFAVSSCNQNIPYVGKLVKRKSLIKADLIEIMEGKTYEVIVDLRSGYEMTSFQLPLKVKFQSLLPVYKLVEGQPKIYDFIEVTSNSVEFKNQ